MMARAFSDEEKEKIKENLIREGRELFIRYGLKKTSINDLTDSVGIAQGSFYTFFSSKEELYFEIFEREEDKLQQKLLESNLLTGEITAKEIEEFLLQGFKCLEDNPLLKRLYTEEDEYQLLLRKLPEEKIKKHIEGDEEVLLPLIKKWQEEEIIIQERPEVIVGLLRSLFVISLHKKEIGEDVFDDTVKLMIKLIAQGLCKSS